MKKNSMEMKPGICTCGNRPIPGNLANMVSLCDENHARLLLNSYLAPNLGIGGEQKLLESCRDSEVAKLQMGNTQDNQALNELSVHLNFKWKNGSVIKVKFLGGVDPNLQKLIIAVAKEWETYANITFDFIEKGDAHVRITNELNGRSWSYLGTDCLNYKDQNTPTLNFGWFTPGTAVEEIRRTTLHEFGHVLGCIHEHNHPEAGVIWDEKAVLRVYTVAHKWTEDQVRRNILATFPQESITNSVYDPDSIMHYSFDADLTMNKVAYGMNMDLSDRDKAFIGIVYPK